MSTSSACLGRPLAKLEHRVPFSTRARAAFLGTRCVRRPYDDQRDVAREGDRTRICRFLESGVVSRSKSLPNGGRQIVAFHVAGDLVDLQSALLLVADSTLRTHGRCVLLEVSTTALLQLAEDFPEIARAFWFDTLVDSSIFREWSLNLGRRSARERTAHLILEIGYRMQEAKLDPRDDFFFPITQLDMADALGLTVVHVNRSLKWLREAGYIATAKKRMVIRDWDVLAHFAAFQSLYLHPEGPRTLST